jgi:hypothetical protein
MMGDFTRKLNDYFRTKVEIPRIMRGESQEIETLINEEAFQKFAMEPEMLQWMNYNTTEIKVAMTLEESMKLLK